VVEHLADNVLFGKSSDRRWAVLLLLRTICLALYALGFLTTTFYLEQRTREWDPALAGYLFGGCRC
jgi:hypothetical protein